MIDMLSYILQGAAQALLPMNLLMMFVGLVVGIIGGMLPGITTVTAVALFVPFTFSMPPDMALIALGGVFCGAMYGGANAAILINTPGQPGSIATTLDGYPLTLQGRAPEALYLALLGSVFGGIFGSLALLLFFEPLSLMALQFGSEAFFWMGLFGLSTLAAMFPGNIMKGLLGGALGLALCTVGLDPVQGLPRFTFGCFTLVQGLDMVSLMIGLFSVSQMLIMLESDEQYIASMARQAHALRKAVKGTLGHLKLLCATSALGTFIGALPGAGGSVAALVAYNEVKRWDKHPERFGEGAVEGILAPESANNASVGGALVPLLSLGIPGSAAAAVLAGGLMAQGLTPGPQLMEKNPEIAYAFIVSLIIANIGMFLVGALLVRVCTRILDVPKLYIIPTVISISFLGAYALRNNLFDVLLMILSGGIAYLLLKARIMPAGIALGLVLGRIIEESLVVTLYRTQAENSLADLLIFSPLAAVFMSACVLAVAVPIYLNHRKGQTSLNFSEIRLDLGCFQRYDFWVVLCITGGGVFLFMESLAMEGISRYFPLAVYASVTILGALILLMELFSLDPRKRGEPGRGKVAIILYLLMMSVSYALLEVLGFYTATFLCVLAMTGYGMFVLSGKPLTLRNVLAGLTFSAGILLVEYGCFTLLMDVQPPTGLWL